jgi:hypothetical protein
VPDGELTHACWSLAPESTPPILHGVPSPAAEPDDVHEWISFDDPREHRTWMFDATFLMSRWSCIYGNGCKGVLDGDAEHLAQGCCSYGAHFVDDEDVANVVAHVVRLRPEHWKHHRDGAKNGFLEPDGEGGTKTRTVDGACIFHNPPDFPGGMGCAFHIAASEAGERPLDWKPNVCWQLPLRLQHHTDDDGYVTSVLREWKRRDWGDGGAEFHWWCTESPDAFVGGVPTYQYLRDEIIEMVGQEIHDLMVERLEPRTASGTWVPLPHPALKNVSHI